VRADASGPGAWADEETGVSGEPARQVVNVDGTPMSALVLAVPRPRAVLVAVHGGAVTSAYYDATDPGPHASLLRVGAALGYTTIGLDRPGYGSSASHQERMSSPADRVDLAYGAIERLLDGRPHGAGVFLVGHSIGGALVVRMAAGPRGAELLGLEIAGIGLAPHQEAAFMTPLVNGGDPGTGAVRPGPPGLQLQEALWKPRRLYPRRAALSLGYAAAPGYEGDDVRGWVGAFPALAAAVRVPVHYTLGDHERVWSSGPAALAEVGALFTASPRVVTAEQADAAHNLSLGWTALSYHLKVLSFLEECVVAREHAD
jgi:pimeloyl-ACP methyl ester carboxylesterase